MQRVRIQLTMTCMTTEESSSVHDNVDYRKIEQSNSED
jgi:hypothetical protein